MHHLAHVPPYVVQRPCIDSLLINVSYMYTKRKKCYFAFLKIKQTMYYMVRPTSEYYRPYQFVFKDH